MKNDTFRILLCANACRPDSGSEPGVGWLAYQTLRKKHKVRVICSAAGKDAIENAAQAGRAQAGDFVFIPERWKFTGRPQADRLISWFNLLSYQSHLARMGEAQIKEFCPDLIHHVTVATWRTGNPLVGCGVPLVWGPLGGGETLAPGFLGTFSLYSRMFETLRSVSGTFFSWRPRVRKTARLASWIFASNQETFRLLGRMRGNVGGMEILPVVFFAKEKMDKFVVEPRPFSPPPRPMQIFSSGLVEARKGIDLALLALREVRQRGFEFEYVNSGTGPERAMLEKRTQSLQLQSCAKFVGHYPQEGYLQKLRTSDIFLFPSLRDNCPATLLEAMGFGCVPVVADHGGPGEVVTTGCGIKIPVQEPGRFVMALADALARLFQDADLRARMGRAAHERVREEFSEEKWLDRVERAYRTVAHHGFSG